MGSSSDSNPFVLPIDQYKRDIDVIKHYVHQTAQYISLRTGCDLRKAVNYVRNVLKPGGKHALRDPIVKMLERGANGDRDYAQTTLSVFLQEVIADESLIAPTLTVYHPRHKKRSFLVDFVDQNIAKRNKNKKAKFAAKMAGDSVLAGIMDNRQNNNKTSNNSLSGAHVSYSTPLANKTAHSTLTSTCRTTSGYGNANNEKLLDGNRHYHTPDIVRNNIISIVFHSNYDQIELAMEKFGIRHPTVDEVMGCITYSTNLYWRSPRDLDDIRKTVECLTPIQRSAFVYTGDMYHLMKYNEEMMRSFISKLSARAHWEHQHADDAFANLPETYVHLAVQICEDFMKGNEVDKKNRTIIKKGKEVDPVQGPIWYRTVAATAQNINDTLEEYREMIRAFWVTPNVPASLAHFPDSIRRSALMSDTDSTIFTVQDWVIWSENGLSFSAKANGVAATMIFLASQTITHILAKMSANMGIERDRLFKIAMKNEYKFDVFVPTQVAKHYFAQIGCQEGNLYEKYDTEIKGVHLKNSNVSKAIMKQAEEMMQNIMNTVIRGELIDLRAIMKEIADTERGIVDAIRSGSHEYFKFLNIKSPDSYTKGEDESAYQSYLLWEEVFAPKYGNTLPPPYTAIKVSVDLDKPFLVNQWLSAMQDKELAERMKAWIKRSGKKGFTTMNLPAEVVAARGIPEEIFNMIDTRKIVLGMTTVFYIILETLGVYMLNNKTTRLCMDEQ